MHEMLLGVVLFCPICISMDTALTVGKIFDNQKSHTRTSLLIMTDGVEIDDICIGPT